MSVDFFTGHRVAMSGIVDTSPISPHTQMELLPYSKVALAPQLDVPGDYVTQLSKEILDAMTLEGQAVSTMMGLDELVCQPSILLAQEQGLGPGPQLKKQSLFKVN
jgi:hypothetical protein